MSLITFCISAFFLWLFALAGYHKFSNVGYYTGLMQDYGIRPPALQQLLVYGLALLECAIALLILIPLSRNLALLLCIALLTIYAAGMAAQLLQGHRDLRCGCAGPASNTTISPALIVRNLLLAALASLALAANPSYIGSLQEVLLALLITPFLIVFYLCSEQLLSNQQQLRALRG